MATTVQIDPVSRIEGHLGIEVTIDTVGGVQKVTSAKSSGTMFRGFETILQGRDPRDATHYTQRICGVCPVAHGMASSLALEQAFGVAPPDNGRIIRNLVLGANFLQSHVLHFYHLAALDFIDTTGLVDMAPWTPRIVSPDMLKGAIAQTLVGHYVQALAIRRKAHQMGAIFGAKLPDTMVFVPGGSTEVVTADKIRDFSALLTEISDFINGTYLPDVRALATAYSAYYKIGKGPGNLLAYGVFDLDAAGATKLLMRGRYTNGINGTVDPSWISEYTRYSWFSLASSNLNPANGTTVVMTAKPEAYSWIKAPRYQNIVHEVGALARMWVNGDYRKGISVMDRHAARAAEAQKIAVALGGWLNQLQVGNSAYTYSRIPAAATAIGMTEAPRGALGHWVQIANFKISRYQIVTPTGWNASPRDDQSQPGAIEQALTGAQVRDIAQPIELIRIIHSFDPCLSCSVHTLTPNGDGRRFLITA